MATADAEEDGGERHQPAPGRPERPAAAQPALGAEPIVIPFLAVERQDRGEDDGELGPVTA